jgi:hypothetical protein
MDLRCGFDQILEMGSGKEVSEVNKFAMVLILDINNTPSVLTSTNWLSSNDDIPLRSNNSEWNNVLQ